MPRIKINIYKKDMESDYYKFFNNNPKGKNANDCVCRAVAAALDKDYSETMRDMVEYGLKNGYTFNEDKCIKPYLESKGMTTFKEPRNHDNKKITLERFLKLNPKGTFIVKVGSHHVTFVKDGCCFDTWDCTSKLVHRYWGWR